MEKKQVATFDGNPVYAYSITNHHGVRLTALNYGGAITEIIVPDKDGKKENVVISYDNYASYQDNPYYLGVLVGRTSGRTKNSELHIDGETISLDANDGKNHLHGGTKGLAKSFWAVKGDSSSLHFEYTSPDGEDHYPGNVTFQVTYQLTDDNELVIDYNARTDKKTPINLTNHTYFNLTGNMKHDILDHELQLASKHFYALDEESIPTGKRSVEDIPSFNFQEKKQIKQAINVSEEQIAIVGGGIDHPFLLDGEKEESVVLSDPKSGRSLSVVTNNSAVVIYSGNQVEAAPLLNGGRAMKYAGICLETQEPPNQNSNYLLNSGERYEKRTVFRFSY